MVAFDRRSLVGYCVIRQNPWHFLGIYATHKEADQQAKMAGKDYEVAFGAYYEKTDEFVALGPDRKGACEADAPP